MKRFLFTLIFIFPSIICFSQNGITDYGKYYKSSEHADMSDLSWIRSSGDFNQQNLNSVDIDNKISQLINRSGDTYSIECPYNSQQLEYLGFINPDSLKVFPQNWFNKNYTIASVKQHIYRYGIFYIAVADDSKMSALNVYFTVRALNILKYKYQDAYTRLIDETLFFPYRSYINSIVNRQVDTVKFLNSNKFFFIVFNSSPTGTAAGITAFPYFSTSWIKNPAISISQNFPIITISTSSLKGDNPNIGSGSIYKYSLPELNYQMYMRDGLVETICHEFIHRYIDVYYSVDKLCNNLFRSKGRITGVNGDASLSNLEEVIVRYTAIDYFTKAGGISPAMLQFEHIEGDLNCVDFINSGKINEYMTIVNGLKNTHDSDIYKVFTIPLWSRVYIFF
jgi:hypothetical protein